MSRKHHPPHHHRDPAESPPPEEDPAPSTPPPADEVQDLRPREWVVLKKRLVAITGTVTWVQVGKIIKDHLIAEHLIKQGVEMEVRLRT